MTSIRFTFVAASSLLLLLACGEDPSASRQGVVQESGGTGGMNTVVIGVGGGGGSSGSSSTLTRTCESGCKHFPEQAFFDSGADASDEELFATGEEGSPGGCLLEPQDGAMVPANWLRPRVRWTPVQGEDVWEIRVHTKREAHDLRVYTRATEWVMPADLWTKVAGNSWGDSLSFTIRGTSRNGGATSRLEGTLHLAPVLAGGSMVYWAADGPVSAGGESWLVGFGVGEEGTVDALRVEQVVEFPVLEADASIKPGSPKVGAGEVRCIGCHTSTPDGSAVAFADDWPWNIALASVEEGKVGQRPSAVTQAGSRLIQQPWLGTPTFSKQDWEQRRYLVTSVGDPDTFGWPGPNKNATGKDRLAWFDVAYPGTLPDSGAELNQAVVALEGLAYGEIVREGDDRGAVNPDWSHDGSRIVYTSASATADGHPGPRTDAEAAASPPETDIFVVPFNEGAGGPAKPLLGAAETGVQEYYPDFSSDDQFVAFTRAAVLNDRKPYYRPDGEIFVVSAEGGEARRLSANDPPECSGEVSPGVINSWPKWSPSVRTFDGRRYYFLVFSSARAYPGQFELPQDQWSPQDTRTSQLYMAVLVVEDGRVIEDYPAVYLWNQTTHTTNLTPAWDEFRIPPVVLR